MHYFTWKNFCFEKRNKLFIDRTSILTLKKKERKKKKEKGKKQS